MCAFAVVVLQMLACLPKATGTVGLEVVRESSFYIGRSPAQMTFVKKVCGQDRLAQLLFGKVPAAHTPRDA